MPFTYRSNDNQFTSNHFYVISTWTYFKRPSLAATEHSRYTTVPWGVTYYVPYRRLKVQFDVVENAFKSRSAAVGAIFQLRFQCVQPEPDITILCLKDLLICTVCWSVWGRGKSYLELNFADICVNLTSLLRPLHLSRAPGAIGDLWTMMATLSAYFCKVAKPATHSDQM